jgi:hypothetical protein
MITVEAIVAVEAAKAEEASMTCNKRKNNIISECPKLRAKGVREEPYLQATFAEDVQQSLTEVKYIASYRK